MKILLVDDDQETILSLSSILEGLGHEATGLSSGLEAVEEAQKTEYELIISDYKMPNMSGLELLKMIKKKKPHSKHIIYSGYADPVAVATAFRHGVYDFLFRPIKIDELITIINELAEQMKASETEKESSTIEDNNDVYFFSEHMLEIKKRALRFHADKDVTVTIEGETGTGKEVIAKYIHYGSEGTIQSPLITINCAAIPVSLFESELFGYEGGTFTGGAIKGKKGKIDIAEGGTLFLDEIGDVSPEIQVKLLRFIEEKEYYRVGGLKKMRADIRIICATNVNLKERVAAGTFRKDLYYRLSAATIKIPPLRQRKDEIIPLAKEFLNKYAQQKNNKCSEINKEAQEIMLNYHWPGNVRELKNAIHRFCFEHNEEIMEAQHIRDILENEEKKEAVKLPDILPEREIVLPSEPFKLDDLIDEMVLKAIEKYGGNKTLAASHLGISRRALYCRLERMTKK